MVPVATSTRLATEAAHKAHSLGLVIFATGSNLSKKAGSRAIKDSNNARSPLTRHTAQMHRMLCTNWAGMFAWSGRHWNTGLVCRASVTRRERHLVWVLPMFLQSKLFQRAMPRSKTFGPRAVFGLSCPGMIARPMRNLPKGISQKSSTLRNLGLKMTLDALGHAEDVSKYQRVHSLVCTLSNGCLNSTQMSGKLSVFEARRSWLSFALADIFHWTILTIYKHMWP
jgi:hypothetical protein